MTDAADLRPEAVADARREVPSWRLVVTLTAAGALAGLLLVFVFQATAPAIEAHRRAAEERAVREVLKGPARFETLYVHGGRLLLEADLPTGGSTRGLERVFRGYDEEDRPLGFALVTSAQGYADLVVLMFGYDPSRPRILGMKILESRETPGIADGIEKEPFTTQFARLVPRVDEPPALLGVKEGKASKEGTPERLREVDMITGATISSRAVVQSMNDALERLHGVLAAYDAEERR